MRDQKRKNSEPDKTVPVLKEVESGEGVAGVCRRHGISEPPFYRWHEKFGGMAEEEAVRLKALGVFSILTDVRTFLTIPTRRCSSQYDRGWP